MDNNEVIKIVTKGFDIFSILTIIFIILKAFGIINFTWLQCFLPLILGLELTTIFLIAVIVALIMNRY